MSAEESFMSAPLIIDTDAGYDDLLALLYLLGDPTISIQAITAVYGLTTDLLLAGNVLRYMLEHTGNKDIPVFLGSTIHGPEGHSVPEGWANKVARLEWPAPQTTPYSDAVAYLAEQISGNTPLKILALGPLTNIAAALMSQQDHCPLRIEMMGGAFGLNGEQALGNMEGADPSAPQSEFNVYIDPDAARQVFAKISDILDILVVPLNACSKVPIDRQFISDFAAISFNGPRTVLAKEVLGRILADNQKYIDDRQYFAWDPLTVAASALQEPERMAVTVDNLGVTSSPGPGSGRVWVALAADPVKFRSEFFGRFS
jgi:inosine-uridine nucleoside N-ribohydrolase